MEADMRNHFFKHGKPGFDEEKKSCHWCQIKSFPSHKLAPITIVNDIDDTVMPRDFQFISTIQYGAGVAPVEDSFRSGCECLDDRSCHSRGCSCLGEVVSGDSSDDEGGGGGNYRGSSVSVKKTLLTAYCVRGPRIGLLRQAALESLAPIYECHQACSCSRNCVNRVVERGRTVPLQIFRTSNGRGWGVRSTVDIRAGQFVDKYIGQIITATEADRRRKRAELLQRKDVYLFELDKFFDPASIDERLSAPPLFVDGEFMSGPTRFVNHSCNPNMKIFVRVGDHADKHIQDLALFAIKNIPAGTELTFDYLNGKVDGEEDEDDPAKVAEMVRCLCGSKNCRGYLW
ncbi:Histone-lysine N-methyltransferase,H3 lysine-9 specific dim-5 [Ceratocystis fimbriata CBS 114723]|uniref:Histone-lysine N-methyltransferase,H3 lysine-9 specific dim-5 n=1 Tax=Ceratocystis fimbriata CBS 114723 TaxID=1035309 RepID=A0A2C5WVS2_9PEZI|nr:Histone-lysine N-methyltransferase,H3 lysine-9 specific dim-5 [Ceratocystis fimbriata CBS 114723]